MAGSPDADLDAGSDFTRLIKVLNREENIDALSPLIAAIGDEAEEIEFSNTAIGIDTNILLKLSKRKEAEDVFDYLGSNHQPPLILPGQAVQEFWNNQLNAIQTRADKLARKFEGAITESGV